MDYKKDARIFRALADENRLAIVHILGRGEQCACTILEQLNITQPTLSHHMRILCEADIVVGRKVGKWTHYRINNDGCEYVKKIVTIYVDDECEGV